MFIGIDVLGLGESGTTLQTVVRHGEYIQIDGFHGLWDNFYIDTNTEFDFVDAKPTLWNYSTLVNATFKNTLEAGNISGEGYQIEYLKVQKRKADKLTWIPLAILPYDINTQDYSVMDKYIANDEDYVYSVMPVAANVVGTRIVSEPVRTNFSGVFISDKSSNFELAYDVEYGEITHNTLSNTFEPLDSKYPIVVYSNSDYATFSVMATHITNNSAYGEVDVKAEKQARDNLMRFLKDRKPKVYRDGKGDLKIITISGKPTEQPHTINGIMKVSFDAIEIGNVEDMDTLISYGLVDWISDLI